ncbi:MAG: tRNA-(ms[2]io[6]A)-hydroxylase [Labilithrix sp.]|nr:tRNA-(ms[2]io[6]A)-hydroxylase [Labilithrix sp.]MCW5811087.1 tRNA-(ms[2]io[6]A)-hydroxylase [Labilithrix sp.]
MLCLRQTTDEAWAREAIKDLDAVLVDHAHCEMKAATNALSLVVRHPQDLGLVRALTAIAQEELEHFDRVVAFLAKRGLALGVPPVDDYAAQLRRAMNALPPSELPLLANRLLVGALIEARSCERFKLLLSALPADCADDLRVFYQELFECEAKHYRQYVDLAKQAAGPLAALVEPRLELLAEAEARIVRGLAESDQRGAVHG